MAASLREPVNILLVDDQPGKLLTYQAILEGLGERLITASSASEALGCLLRQEIAVVLVDVCMPDLDGYQLASMIRQHPRYQQTSIIFVSAILMTDLDRLRGYECGAVDYVPVPVVPEILRAKVSVFADLYRKSRELERLNVDLERRVAERTAALEEADRRKDEFLARLAHELRNPLAPIRTAVQLLRFRELPEAQRASARDVIERQVEHLVRLIDDLLDVSRITRGMITLQRSTVDVRDAVLRAVETVRPAIDGRAHGLQVDLPEVPVLVEADATRLAQAIGNVLGNAAKFTEPGGSITVTVVADAGEAVTRVTDSGIGIPADMLDAVFDLFVQGDHGDRPHAGLGIGLALVRRLIQMLGGQVTARSAGPGLGSEFEIRLPLTVCVEPVLPGEPAAPPPVPPRGVPRRILVVDDNVDAADALTTLLRLAGHDVHTAHDGEAALEAAGTCQPEVVFLDLGMPRLDGFDTAAELRRRHGHRMALVALTGWGQERDRQATARAGFDAHLVKPVAEKELFRVLATAKALRAEV
jgi:signal transduction histidine kinase